MDINGIALLFCVIPFFCLMYKKTIKKNDIIDISVERYYYFESEEDYEYNKR